MFYIICYDISVNRTRLKVANKLLEHGLFRLQYSVFVGSIPKSRLSHIQNWIENTLKLHPNDSIAFIPISKQHLSTMRIIGKNTIDKSLILNERHTLIL